MKLFRTSVVLPLAAAAIAITPAIGSDIPIGTYEGGGRACTGRLSITAKTLSWHTSFSRCDRLPYDFANLGDNKGVITYLFHLKHSQPGCLYRSVELHRRTAPDGSTTWEAVGYLTREDQEAKRLDQALACPVVH